MGIMSTLALLSLPLLKRPELADKRLPAFLDPRVIENAALKSRILELQAEIDNLQGKLDVTNRDVTLTRRERDHWHALAISMSQSRQKTDYSAMQGFQQPPNQNYQQANLGLAQSQLQSAMAQAAQNQVSSWHDCTCVPGRSAAFGILGVQSDG